MPYEVKVRVWHNTGTPAYSRGDVTDRPCPAILGGTTCSHYQIEYYLTDDWPEMLIGVGTNRNFVACWQSPDLPAPTITPANQRVGGCGWLLEERDDMLVYRSDNSSGFKAGLDFSVDRPALTVLAEGLGGDSLGHWHFADDGKPASRPEPMTEAPATAKPPYRVPSMAEIAQVPHNGFSVISTFSGCGGSSLGYKMAGFKVLWANEFVPAAQDTYRANHPGTLLDTRDIRQIQPQDILAAIGLQVGQLDLMDGSPPCASFSLAGKREAGWGRVKKYSDTQQRVDDLFFEYARLLKGIRPRVFVAENVSGLVRGTAKGYFKDILTALKQCGYKVKARLLDAQWLGVPQMRQRIIFIGVREDLPAEPAFPKPLPYRYSVREALPWIQQLRIADDWQASDRPAGTVVQSDGARTNTTAYLSSYLVEAEADISNYAIGREWERMGEGGQSRYMQLKRSRRDRPVNTVTAAGGGPGAASVTHPTEKRKFTIAELRRICAFPDDFILTGDYAQQWERLGRAVPPVMMYHIAATVRDEILRGLDRA